MQIYKYFIFLCQFVYFFRTNGQFLDRDGHSADTQRTPNGQFSVFFFVAFIVVNIGAEFSIMVHFGRKTDKDHEIIKKSMNCARIIKIDDNHKKRTAKTVRKQKTKKHILTEIQSGAHG